MKALLKRLPGMDRFVTSQLWRRYRHGVSLRTGPRKNSNFTGFMRLPTQYAVLAGPVIDFLLRDDASRRIRIMSIGCSIGAEAYTVASVLANRRPELDFVIDAFDIEEHVIVKAREGLFDPETEVFNNKRIPEGFIEETFDIEPGGYRIKPQIRSHLNFFVGDVLDRDALAGLGKADLIFAQNFLFHLEPATSAVAFENICELLAPRSVLYVDGTDIPIRNRITLKHGLTPLDEKIEEIHNEARWARAVGWPYHYWGLEPFDPGRRDWKRHYSTIFVKGA